MVNDRPDFDHAPARPRLGHGQGGVEVCNLNQRKASEDFLRLDEGAVGHRHFPVLEPNRGRGVGTLKLFTAHENALLAVLLEPLADLPVLSLELGLGSLLPLLLALYRPREHEDVLHAWPPNLSGPWRRLI